MPGQRANQKVRSHLAVSAEDRNDKEVLEILNGEKTTPFLFGRIETNLGAYFRVKIHDGRTLRDAQASPRGLFRHRKAHMRFHKDEIVVMEGSIDESMTDLERSVKKALIYEIIAKLSKKQAQILYRRGMIHKSVYTAPSANGENNDVDDLIDYGDEEEGEEELDSEEEREITRGGRGSGGKKRVAGGGTGAAARATAVVKEQIDAEEYAQQVEGVQAEGEEGGVEDFEAMADGLGMGGEKRGKDDMWDTPVPGSAAALAAAASTSAHEEEKEKEEDKADEFADERAWAVKDLKTKDRWDDSDSDFDIEGI